MIRWIPLALAASLTGLVACGGAAESKVVKPPAPLSWDSRTPKPHHGPPVLIAPPPAYGNKIVMARAESTAN